jgi:hypothetical protein
MALIKCKKCGYPNPENWKNCFQCGNDMATTDYDNQSVQRHPNALYNQGYSYTDRYCQRTDFNIASLVGKIIIIVLAFVGIIYIVKMPKGNVIQTVQTQQNNTQVENVLNQIEKYAYKMIAIEKQQIDIEQQKQSIISNSNIYDNAVQSQFKDLEDTSWNLTRETLPLAKDYFILKKRLISLLDNENNKVYKKQALDRFQDIDYQWKETAISLQAAFVRTDMLLKK